MHFLHEPAAGPRKIVRTALYGDQEFSRFELEIVHTQLYQRLYDLKQLGYSDRVYPDAVHSRFNHLLGVAEIATRMANHLHRWLSHRRRQGIGFDFSGSDGQVKSISGADLANHLASRVPSLRLMALLHDLTHAAFGHTLEDEVSVFTEKHDMPARQTRFFDALTAHLVTLWAAELRVQGEDILDLEKINKFDVDRAKVLRLSHGISAKVADIQLSDKRKPVEELVARLTELEIAMRLLLALDAAHAPPEEPKEDEKSPEEITSTLREVATTNLLLSEVIAQLSTKRTPIDLSVHRDMFLIDMIGNTICADLIDYARRDAANAGLKVGFDDRILRYLAIVSVKDRFVPGGKPALRSAIQIFTDKLRHDVLSEMSGLLKSRYLISERITFHPTKCAAGACLGTAVQLLGIRNIPAWMQALGDQAFLDYLRRCAVLAELVCDDTQGLFVPTDGREPAKSLADFCSRRVKNDDQMHDMVLESLRNMGCPEQPTDDGKSVDAVRLRLQAARRVLLKLAARRYPKLAYRLHDSLKAGDEVTTEDLAKRYNNPQARYDLERKMESRCSLPIGTVYIHCPKRDTSMKLASALVVGNDLKKVARLRKVTKIYAGVDELRPYQEEIEAIENMYKSIWRFHIYLDAAYVDRSDLVKAEAHKELGFPNDALMTNGEDELPPAANNVFGRLQNHRGKFADDLLPFVVKELDEVHLRLRNTSYSSEEDVDAAITRAIDRVEKAVAQEKDIIDTARSQGKQRARKKDH